MSVTSSEQQGRTMTKAEARGAFSMAIFSSQWQLFSSQWQLSFEQFQIIEVPRGLDALNQAGKDG